jgi:hypothetical protein
MEAHNKPIIETTPQDLSTLNTAPAFNSIDFKRAISNNGYDVTIEKAVMCCCKDRANGHVDTSCRNCGATGWVFVNKKATRALFSHINQKTKYLNWTEDNVGTVNITTHSEDRIGYMDKLTILDVETVFSQVIYFRKSTTGKLFAFLAYVPTEIDLLFLFKGANQPLEHLDPTSYSIAHNRIILDDTFLSLISGITDPQLQYLNATIRYYHQPVYHIIDINREVIKNRSKDCSTGNKTLKELPISSIGRKPHTLYEVPNFLGEGLFDNTIQP